MSYKTGPAHFGKIHFLWSARSSSDDIISVCGVREQNFVIYSTFDLKDLHVRFVLLH